MSYNEPLQLSHDAYLVTRVTSEFFLRAYDAVRDIEEDAMDGLLLMAFVRSQKIAGHDLPVGVREMSRRLDIPYATVRRRVEALNKARRLIAKEDGLVVPDAVLRSRRVTEFLRKIYVEASRLLVDLTRLGVASFVSTSSRPARTGRLTADQSTVAIAAAGLLVACVRAVRFFWEDLIKGLVFTAIWTANVKHVTNTGPAASPAILPDSLRQPVSTLAISQSLRVPYETVRRHANTLIGQGFCARTPGHGLVVLSGVHQRAQLGTSVTHGVAMDFLAELRQAGIKA